MLLKLAIATVFMTTVTLSTAAQATETTSLEIAGFQTEAGTTPNIAHLVGTATNTSNRAFKAAFLKFNLYDQNNVIVGNAIAEVSNLGPGEKWNFDAPTFVPFHHAKIVEEDVY